MGVPGVIITEKNGSLGGQNPSTDHVGGLILSGSATDKIALLEPKCIFSDKEAEALGITGFALEEIKDYYGVIGEGAELWIMLVSKATLLKDICDSTNDMAMKLIDAGRGRINMWGVSKEAEAGYTPVLTGGFDKDIADAMAMADALCKQVATKYKFTCCLLGARHYDGDPSKLMNLKECSYNHVGLTLIGKQGSKDCRMGYALAVLVSQPVHRNAGRVANGALPRLTDAYLSDGVTRAESLSNSQDMIHDKGYIFPIVRPLREGYFFNDVPTATSNSDDYSSFTNRRVQNKVEVIAYDTYLDFVNDDFAVDKSGAIGIAELKRLQGKMSDNVYAQMAESISSFTAFVPAGQDPLGTGKTKVVLKTQPRGYHKIIESEVGFTKTIE